MTELQFKSFLVLAEELNFTKAAKRLCISQSTLSNHISSLEKNLGITLFIRTNKSVALSPEGLHIYPHFYKAYELITQSVKESQKIHNEHENLLRIGFINGLSSECMLNIKKILDAFCQKQPNTQLLFISMNESELMDMLENNQLDLLFTIEGTIKTKSGFRMKTIMKNPIALLYSADKYNAEDLSLDVLKNEPFIAISKENSPSEEFYLRELQEKLNITFPDIIRVESDETRIFEILAGNGIGFSDSATKSLANNNLEQYYIEDFFVQYGFVCEDTTKNKLVTDFFEDLDQLITISSEK